MLSSFLSSPLSFYYSSNYSPKAILASYLSKYLATYFEFDPERIESNLLSDTKIVLYDVVVKPWQHRIIDDHESGGEGLLVLVTGRVEKIEFTWTWGSIVGGIVGVGANSGEGTEFITDVVLGMERIKLHVTSVYLPPQKFSGSVGGTIHPKGEESYRAGTDDVACNSKVITNATKVASTSKSSGSEEWRTKESGLEKYIWQIVDNLTLHVNGLEIIIDLPTLQEHKQGATNDVLNAVRFAVGAVRLVSAGRIQRDKGGDVADSSWSPPTLLQRIGFHGIALDVLAKKKTMEEEKKSPPAHSAALAAEGTRSASSFCSAAVKSTSAETCASEAGAASHEKSVVFPLVEPIFYGAVVKRVSGKRFVDGILSGLRVEGERHAGENGGNVKIHLGDLQVHALSRLNDLICKMNSRPFDSESGEDKVDEGNSVEKKHEKMEDDCHGENAALSSGVADASIFVLPLAGMSFAIPMPSGDVPNKKENENEAFENKVTLIHVPLCTLTYRTDGGVIRFEGHGRIHVSVHCRSQEIDRCDNQRHHEEILSVKPAQPDGRWLVDVTSRSVVISKSPSQKIRCRHDGTTSCGAGYPEVLERETTCGTNDVGAEEVAVLVKVNVDRLFQLYDCVDAFMGSYVSYSSLKTSSSLSSVGKGRKRGRGVPCGSTSNNRWSFAALGVLKVRIEGKNKSEGDGDRNGHDGMDWIDASLDHPSLTYSNDDSLGKIQGLFDGLCIGPSSFADVLDVHVPGCTIVCSRGHLGDGDEGEIEKGVMVHGVIKATVPKITEKFREGLLRLFLPLLRCCQKKTKDFIACPHDTPRKNLSIPMNASISSARVRILFDPPLLLSLEGMKLRWPDISCKEMHIANGTVDGGFGSDSDTDLVSFSASDMVASVGRPRRWSVDFVDDVFRVTANIGQIDPFRIPGMAVEVSGPLKDVALKYEPGGLLGVTVDSVLSLKFLGGGGQSPPAVLASASTACKGVEIDLVDLPCPIRLSLKGITLTSQANDNNSLLSSSYLWRLRSLGAMEIHVNNVPNDHRSAGVLDNTTATAVTNNSNGSVTALAMQIRDSIALRLETPSSSSVCASSSAGAGGSGKSRGFINGSVDWIEGELNNLSLVLCPSSLSTPVHENEESSSCSDKVSLKKEEWAIRNKGGPTAFPCILLYHEGVTLGPSSFGELKVYFPHFKLSMTMGQSYRFDPHSLKCEVLDLNQTVAVTVSSIEVAKKSCEFLSKMFATSASSASAEVGTLDSSNSEDSASSRRKLSLPRSFACSKIKVIAMEPPLCMEVVDILTSGSNVAIGSIHALSRMGECRTDDDSNIGCGGSMTELFSAFDFNLEMESPHSSVCAKVGRVEKFCVPCSEGVWWNLSAPLFGTTVWFNFIEKALRIEMQSLQLKATAQSLNGHGMDAEGEDALLEAAALPLQRQIAPMNASRWNCRGEGASSDPGDNRLSSSSSFLPCKRMKLCLKELVVQGLPPSLEDGENETTTTRVPRLRSMGPMELHVFQERGATTQKKGVDHDERGNISSSSPSLAMTPSTISFQIKGIVPLRLECEPAVPSGGTLEGSDSISTPSSIDTSIGGLFGTVTTSFCGARKRFSFERFGFDAIAISNKASSYLSQVDIRIPSGKHGDATLTKAVEALRVDGILNITIGSIQVTNRIHQFLSYWSFGFASIFTGNDCNSSRVCDNDVVVGLPFSILVTRVHVHILERQLKVAIMDMFVDRDLRLIRCKAIHAMEKGPALPLSASPGAHVDATPSSTVSAFNIEGQMKLRGNDAAVFSGGGGRAKVTKIATLKMERVDTLSVPSMGLKITAPLVDTTVCFERKREGNGNGGMCDFLYIDLTSVQLQIMQTPATVTSGDDAPALPFPIRVSTCDWSVMVQEYDSARIVSLAPMQLTFRPVINDGYNGKRGGFIVEARDGSVSGIGVDDAEEDEKEESGSGYRGIPIRLESESGTEWVVFTLDKPSLIPSIGQKKKSKEDGEEDSRWAVHWEGAVIGPSSYGKFDVRIPPTQIKDEGLHVTGRIDMRLQSIEIVQSVSEWMSGLVKKGKGRSVSPNGDADESRSIGTASSSSAFPAATTFNGMNVEVSELKTKVCMEDIFVSNDTNGQDTLLEVVCRRFRIVSLDGVGAGRHASSLASGIDTDVRVKIASSSSSTSSSFDNVDVKIGEIYALFLADMITLTTPLKNTALFYRNGNVTASLNSSLKMELLSGDKLNAANSDGPFTLPVPVRFLLRDGLELKSSSKTGKMLLRSSSLIEFDLKPAVFAGRARKVPHTKSKGNEATDAIQLTLRCGEGADTSLTTSSKSSSSPTPSVEIYEVLQLQNMAASAIIQSGDLHTLHSFVFSVESMAIHADPTNFDWFSILPQQTQKEQQPYKALNMPLAKVGKIRLFLSYQREILETTVTITPYEGTVNTTFNDLATYYKTAIKQRLPTLLSNVQIMGTNVVDVAAVEASRVALRKMISQKVIGSDKNVLGSGVLSIAATATVDSVKGAVEMGKKSRNAASEEGYRFGDVTRGFVACVKEGAESGGEIRRGGGDDRKQSYRYRVGDLSVGSASAIGNYVSKNKARLGSAGGSGFGMALGTAVLGPVGLVAGAYAGGKAGEKALGGSCASMKQNTLEESSSATTAGHSRGSTAKTKNKGKNKQRSNKPDTVKTTTTNERPTTSHVLLPDLLSTQHSGFAPTLPDLLSMDISSPKQGSLDIAAVESRHVQVKTQEHRTAGGGGNFTTDLLSFEPQLSPKHIFDPYCQSSSSSTDNVGGTTASASHQTLEMRNTSKNTNSTTTSAAHQTLATRNASTNANSTAAQSLDYEFETKYGQRLTRRNTVSGRSQDNTSAQAGPAAPSHQIRTRQHHQHQNISHVSRPPQASSYAQQQQRRQPQPGHTQEGYRFGDITRGIIQEGKKRDGRDANSSYRFGDFTRGLFGGAGGK